jgi:hypothetical protein
MKSMQVRIGAVIDVGIKVFVTGLRGLVMPFVGIGLVGAGIYSALIGPGIDQLPIHAPTAYLQAYQQKKNRNKRTVPVTMQFL